jgi:hypothetical protein
VFDLIRRLDTASTPGKSFEITVTFAGFPVANRRYEFEPAPGGCLVTESWRDNRSDWQRVVCGVMGDHSAAHARQEMAATLANLASVAERDAQSGETTSS